MKELISDLVERKNWAFKSIRNLRAVQDRGEYERGIAIIKKRHKMYCKAIRILKAHERIAP